MRTIARKILKSQRGATAIEYGLIIAMIVLAIMTALTLLAGKTTGRWNNIAAEFNNH